MASSASACVGKAHRDALGAEARDVAVNGFIVNLLQLAEREAAETKVRLGLEVGLECAPHGEWGGLL